MCIPAPQKLGDAALQDRNSCCRTVNGSSNRETEFKSADREISIFSQMERLIASICRTRCSFQELLVFLQNPLQRISLL